MTACMTAVTAYLDGLQRGPDEAEGERQEIELGAELPEHGVLDLKTPADDLCHHDITCSICHLKVNVII